MIFNGNFEEGENFFGKTQLDFFFEIQKFFFGDTIRRGAQKDRMRYLYAMNIYNQEKMKINNGKKYKKENINKRLKLAIQYFTKSKNISVLSIRN